MGLTKQQIEERDKLFSQGLKRCGECGKIKEVDLFSNNKYMKTGKNSSCKECDKERSSQYRKGANKEEILRRTNESYHKNKEKYNATAKKWREANKAKRHLDAKNKYNTDINTKISNNLRGRLSEVIRKQQALKKGKTFELLGCTIEEFKKYIESQFIEGMSWENYGRGGWHLDHKTPCAAFNLIDEEEQKLCFHYTNIQPLWELDNLSKGSIVEGRRVIHKK